MLDCIAIASIEHLIIVILVQEELTAHLPLQQYESHVSEVVLDEISRGDSIAAQLGLEAFEGFIPLEITSNVIGLAQEYYAALELPDKARLDAIRLALAVQHGMDYLVSWNFIHIVGARPRGIVQAINYSKGIVTPIICTPEELFEEELS